MRSIVAFYRARPLVGVVVFTVGLAIAVATTALQDGDGIVLPIAFTALMGLIVGSVVAFGQRRGRRDDDQAALDPRDPRDAEL
jgi:NhaP-type Na+/H+ or K+/H+ antiporter